MIYCKKCLLGAQAEAYAEMVEKCRSAIHEKDRTAPEEMQRRMAVCEECDRFLSGTCRACGCYVELRAMKKATHCPLKKW